VGYSSSYKKWGGFFRLLVCSPQLLKLFEASPFFMMLSQGYPGRTHSISETLARIRILTKKEAQLKNVETLAIEGFL
jgi:hypothetical protein